MIIESFEEWKDEWKAFCDYYSDRGFVELLGLFKYEDVHNNYLNNLLDKNNPYGYELKPMMYFLKLINSKNIELFNDLSNEDDIKDLDVKVRKKLIKSGIPDLFISFRYNDKKYLILLEAKLGSDEHDDQCMEYYKEVSKFSGFDEKIFLYLTLNGKEPDSCKNHEYYPVTYQELIDCVYDPLIGEKSNNISLTVEEYLKGFNSLYDNGYDYKDIPITNRGRELTEILFNHIKNSKISDEEMRTFINNNIYNIRIFLNNVNKIGKSKDEVNNVLINFPKLDDLKPKYIVDNKKCTASRCIYEIFRRINMDDDFDYINLAPDGYKYLYSEEEYDNLNHYRDCYSNNYYGELLLDGEKYYYATYSLSEDEAKELKEKIKDKYPDVFKIVYGYKTQV